MNSKINVQSESISSKINEFKGEMNKLDLLFAKIEKETSEAKSYWEGQASDVTISHLEEFSKIFEAIKAQNEKYVNFLNEVIEKYTDEDDYRSQYVSSNNQAFDAKSIK